MRRAAAAAALVAALTVVVAAAGGVSQAQSADSDATEAERMRAAATTQMRATLSWRRAVWRVTRDDFERARVDLEKAIDAVRTPDTILQFMLGLTYLRLDRLAEADVYLEKARAQRPDFIGLDFTDALKVTAVKAKSADESRERVNRALDLYRAYFARLDAYPKNGLFAAELRFLGHVYRGRLESRVQEEKDHAVADFDAAIELAKANSWAPASDVVSELATVHVALDQLDAAKRVIEDAMARDPAEAVHYYNYGQLLNDSKEYAKARPWFEAALARQSDLTAARTKLAYIGWQLHDPASMLPHLEAVKSILDMRAKAGSPAGARSEADLDSGFGIYWRLVGEDRLNDGDEAGSHDAFEKAVIKFREALAKEPGCVMALNMLVQLSTRIAIPAAEVEEWKRRLHDLNERLEHEVEPFKSTFC